MLSLADMSRKSFLALHTLLMLICGVARAPIHKVIIVTQPLLASPRGKQLVSLVVGGRV